MKTINVQARMPICGKAFYFNGLNYNECRTLYKELYYEGEENDRTKDQEPTNGRVKDVCCKDTWVVVTPDNDYWLLDDFMFKRIYYDVDDREESEERFRRLVANLNNEPLPPSASEFLQGREI